MIMSRVHNAHVASSLGLMNSHIPEEYGGLGLGGVETSIIGSHAACSC